MKTTHFKGRLYLDVDGVINGYSAGDVWPDARGAKIENIEIHWSPEVIRRLDAVRAQHSIELVWCTSWLWHPDALAELPEVVDGLRGGRRLEAPPVLMASWGWKLRALRSDTQNDPLPFCWADDVEITTWGRHAQDAAIRAGLSAPLLVQPDELGMRGLESRHLEQIEDWARSL